MDPESKRLCLDYALKFIALVQTGSKSCSDSNKNYANAFVSRNSPDNLFGKFLIILMIGVQLSLGVLCFRFFAERISQ